MTNKVYLALYKGKKSGKGMNVLAAVLPRVSSSRGRWFCSEWCATALGLDKPQTYSPNDLANKFK